MQNLSFIREELDDFAKFLNFTFGEGVMSESLTYINKLILIFSLLIFKL